jgi:hypothetical protein
MSGTAPFQLYVDLPAISAAVILSGTVTITTSSAHSVATGSYVQVEGLAGAGTAMNGVFQVTATSGTTLRYTSGATSGTVTGTNLATGAASQDVLNPLGSYASASRPFAVYVELESLAMSASGDGNTSSMSFTILQDVTPTTGPWHLSIPDQARIRLYKKNTGSAPTDATDLYFIGTISGVSARINDSGQGTICDVEIEEVNGLLDRLVVFGKTRQARDPEGEGAFSRSGNVTTVTTSTDHGYAIGDQVKIASVIGGSNASFNGTFTITSTPSDDTFTYANSGNTATGDNWRGIGTIAHALKGSKKVLNKVRVTLASTAYHGLKSGDTIQIRDAVGSTPKATAQINAIFTGSNVVRISDTVLELTLSSKLDNAQTWTSAGEIRGIVTITPIGSQTQTTIPIIGGEDEGDAVRKVLSTVNSYKRREYPVQRLVSTSTTSGISSSVAASSDAGLSIPGGTLRSVLDSIVELYGGQDSKERRYFINLTNRALQYRLVNTANQPAFANAPYRITTSSPGTPNTTTAAASIAPHSLEVSYDHQTTKQALFGMSSTTGATTRKVIKYTEVGFSNRAGAPVFDGVVEFPTAAASPATQVTRAAKSYFIERHKPLLTGTFTLRGAGTAAHNNLGFSAGYYQTGASSFALQSRWEPGQWVHIECVPLSLSGIFRVETVDWSLEPGSYIQVIRVTFNRRSPNNLVDTIKRGNF